VHWYPYPFLDADNLGYANDAAYIVAITIFMMLVAWALGTALRGRGKPAR
jgi:hypothetical protein